MYARLVTHAKVACAVFLLLLSAQPGANVAIRSTAGLMAMDVTASPERPERPHVLTTLDVAIALKTQSVLMSRTDFVRLDNAVLQELASTSVTIVPTPHQRGRFSVSGRAYSIHRSRLCTEHGDQDCSFARWHRSDVGKEGSSMRKFLAVRQIVSRLEGASA